jgi:putative molybdopterin biosynthesis protein
MKRARAPIDRGSLARPDVLLTTGDVARLLRVHPKHVYRLLRQGLPGRRVGGEWRFSPAEVLAWKGSPVASPVAAAVPSPLVAANGDIAVECLIARLVVGGEGPIGFVQADSGEALELLRRGAVLAAGCHGAGIPGAVGGERVAFIRLVDRTVGLVVRPGVKIRSLRQVGRWRLASRPSTAGVRVHFDRELRRLGVDPEEVHLSARLLPSHREVACAVARGEADVGLASAAWASRVGLDCVPICREPYGLLVKASTLGDPRVVRICEAAQTSAFRKELSAVNGYEVRRTGALTYGADPRSLS